MARAANLTGFHSYATEYIKRRLVSSLFKRVPFLSIMAAKGTMSGTLGRPGVAALIGGMSGLTGAKREATAGSTYKHVRFHTGKVGGVKHLGERGTTASTGNDSQDQKVRSAIFAWSMAQAPIKVWKNTIRMATGKYQVASAVEEATEMASEELIEDIAAKLQTGDPTDQTAEIWDAPIGLQNAIHDTNTYGNVNRSTYTTWAGHRVTTATGASLELIDKINVDYDASGTGLANKGPGIDLVLTGNTIYNKLKQEAVAKGVQLNATSVPRRGMIGFLKEAFEYNGVVVTFDPGTPASTLYGLTLADWFFEVHPAENWRVTRFRDGSDDGQPGEDDAITAKINLMYRLSCEKGWNNIQYTSVS